MPRAFDPRQRSLFDPPGADGVVRLPLPGADVTYQAGFLAPEEAAALFAELRDGATWTQHRRTMYGRELAVPRLVSWYGDRPARFPFMDYEVHVRPWLPALAALRPRVEAATGARFNVVLLTRYRDERDGVVWHRDYAALLGRRPAIATVSLGETRRFDLRPQPGRAGEALGIELAPGSLLVMKGDTQENWEHRIAKRTRPLGERISLTWRWLYAPPGDA